MISGRKEALNVYMYPEYQSINPLYYMADADISIRISRLCRQSTTGSVLLEPEPSILWLFSLNIMYAYSFCFVSLVIVLIDRLTLSK